MFEKIILSVDTYQLNILRKLRLHFFGYSRSIQQVISVHYGLSRSKVVAFASCSSLQSSLFFYFSFSCVIFLRNIGLLFEGNKD